MVPVPPAAPPGAWQNMSYLPGGYTVPTAAADSSWRTVHPDGGAAPVRTDSAEVVVKVQLPTSATPLLKLNATAGGLPRATSQLNSSPPPATGGGAVSFPVALPVPLPPTVELPPAVPLPDGALVEVVVELPADAVEVLERDLLDVRVDEALHVALAAVALAVP